jgi:hypothetical protein
VVIVRDLDHEDADVLLTWSHGAPLGTWSWLIVSDAPNRTPKVGAMKGRLVFESGIERWHILVPFRYSVFYIQTSCYTHCGNIALFCGEGVYWRKASVNRQMSSDSKLSKGNARVNFPQVPFPFYCAVCRKFFQNFILCIWRFLMDSNWELRLVVHLTHELKEMDAANAATQRQPATGVAAQ